MSSTKFKGSRLVGITELNQEELEQNLQHFKNLLHSVPEGTGVTTGRIMSGIVTKIDEGGIIVDVGVKAEGRIPRREFENTALPEIGSSIEVYVDRLEDPNGYLVMSWEKGRKERVWQNLETLFHSNTEVNGTIVRAAVRGGYEVDLGGAIAFLPNSLVDLRHKPKENIAAALIGKTQPFKIESMDRIRGNIVVSRRAVLEKGIAEARKETVAKLEEGQIIEGVVKNITNYGAFIDLGNGVDGLLHVTDLAWKRVDNPHTYLTVGEKLKVMVIRCYSDKGEPRISLGIKQLNGDPWEQIENKYTKDQIYTGKVNNILDYGAFVELEPGVEGLVHVSAMSWTKKNVNPRRIVTPNQEVKVKILDIDKQQRRIGLSMKACYPNPWLELQNTIAVGSVIEVVVKNSTDFGVFVGINDEIDGMIHLSDISWEGASKETLADFKPNEKIKVKVLEINAQEEKVSLGIKQLSEDPFESEANDLKKGDVITCTVVRADDNGIEVKFGEKNVLGYIKKSDLARDKVGQKPELFASGEKVDAKIIQVDKSNRKVQLSIKAREIDEHNKALKEYGSSDSGASLGEILGIAMAQAPKKGDKSDK